MAKPGKVWQILAMKRSQNVVKIGVVYYSYIQAYENHPLWVHFPWVHF